MLGSCPSRSPIPTCAPGTGSGRRRAFVRESGCVVTAWTWSWRAAWHRARAPSSRLRAEQLTSRRCRRSFAAGITRVVEAAEEPQNPRTSAVPVMRADILACRRELADLSALLSSGEELQLRGLAQLEAFLTAGESPLFNPNPEDTLEHAARRIRAALLLR